MSKRFGLVFLDPTEPNNTEPNLRYSVNSIRFGRTLKQSKSSILLSRYFQDRSKRHGGPCSRDLEKNLGLYSTTHRLPACIHRKKIIWTIGSQIPFFLRDEFCLKKCSFKIFKLSHTAQSALIWWIFWPV